MRDYQHQLSAYVFADERAYGAHLQRPDMEESIKITDDEIKELAKIRGLI